MSTRKRTPEEVLEAVREATLDDLAEEIGALSPEEVDRRLNAAGGDAAGTAKRALARVAGLKERRARLPWQEEARAKLAANREAFRSARARRPKLPREELMARIGAAEREAASHAPIVTFFRKRTTAEMTDEELEALLDEIETARALADAGGGKKET